jgi:phosphatidylglycerophosphate synthase
VVAAVRSFIVEKYIDLVINSIRDGDEMFDIQLRSWKERILSPIAARIPPVITADMVTVIGFTFGAGAAGLIVIGKIKWALALWVVNRVVDGLDGAIARNRGSQSDFGGYLDIMLDFLVYSAIPLAFAVYSGTTLVWAATAGMLAAFYINGASWMYLSALAARRRGRDHNEQTTVTMPPGVVEGAETIVMYTLFFLFPQYVSIWFSIMTAATLAGVVQRMVWAHRNVHAKPT